MRKMRITLFLLLVFYVNQQTVFGEQGTIFLYAGKGNINLNLNINYIGALLDIQIKPFLNFIPKGFDFLSKIEIGENHGAIDWKAPWFNIELREQFIAGAAGISWRYNNRFWVDTKAMLEYRNVYDAKYHKTTERHTFLIESYLGDSVPFTWEWGSSLGIQLETGILNILIEPKVELMSCSISNKTLGDPIFSIKIGPSFRSAMGGGNTPIAIGGTTQLWLELKKINIGGGGQIRVAAQNHGHRTIKELTFFLKVLF